MFQQKLKELREKNGYKSQAAFAIAFGVAQSTVGGWESGKREPNYETTKKLAQFFNVPIDYLIGDSDLADTFLTDYQQIRIYELFENACDRKGVTPAFVVSQVKCHPYTLNRLKNRTMHGISKNVLINIAAFLDVSKELDYILTEEPKFDNFLLAVHEGSADFSEEDKQTILNMVNYIRSKNNKKSNGKTD